jgi:hypothetical protein
MRIFKMWFKMRFSFLLRIKQHMIKEIKKQKDKSSQQNRYFFLLQIEHFI